jgi:UDP-glucose 4-epimerase
MSPYGRSKLIVENILEDLSVAGVVRYVSLRFFNAAGADPEGEIGELHDPEPHIIPRALMAATGEFAARDYIHLSDVAIQEESPMSPLHRMKGAFYHGNRASSWMIGSLKA